MRLDTFDDLSERYGAELPSAVAELRTRLVQEHELAVRSLHGESLESALAELRDEQLRAPGWTFEADGFDALSSGLERIYRRGRKEMTSACCAFTSRSRRPFSKARGAQALLAVIDRRESKLCKKALGHGRKLYAHPTKRFVRDIRRGWHRRAADRPRA